MRALRSIVLAVVLLATLPAAASAIVPAGFQETTVWNGLVNPTAIEFAADGRVFVGEKRGRIVSYDSLADPTPTVVADLSNAVHDFWDRGLLGMALDPEFTTGRPYIYVLYTYNKDPSDAAFPRWPDSCPTPPGATGDGCVVSGRLSRLTLAGVETPLITDWCQQYPSHSVGDLVFGPGRALYLSAGDGASFNFADYGQDGAPVNPCGDPGGAAPTPPTAEGGALRAQDVRTSGDPTGGDGAILRVDPDTGDALPDNPAAGSADPMTRRIVAHGFRNPFRLTLRPGTGEVWAGDVGWNEWEEVDRVAAPTSGVGNYGWPCYEGAGRMGSYDNLNLNLCETLYAQGAASVVTPHYTYRHADKVVAGEACPAGGSAISGLQFYTGTRFPAAYRDGLFFADYTRSCIWFMPKGADGLPDPAQRQTFASGATGIVNLIQGPDGNLYYPDLNGGTVKRISFGSPNDAPTARATATPASGAVPLAVQFDGTTSTDPNGDTLTYAWDLDGDGDYDDSDAARPTRTYTTPEAVTVRLRVTDSGGLQGTDSIAVRAGAGPDARIDTPLAGTQFTVDETIGFSGGATDWEGAAIPASGLSWKLTIQHCWEGDPQNCHSHPVQTWSGVASGSFPAPDHEYPSHLELELTATDAGGLTQTVKRRIDPRTVDLTFETSPPGLQLSVGSHTAAAPFTRTVLRGSAQSVTADASQTLAGTTYAFTGWSDGGAATHQITAPATATTYRATYAAQGGGPAGLVGAWSFDEPSGPTVADASGRANPGTISGATRNVAGRFGGALTFDGVNDMVTVSDAASLDLTTGMTLEAWVNPSALGSAWRTAMLKEGGGLSYALYAHDGAGHSAGYIDQGTDRDVVSPAALPLNAWSHLAVSYDGGTMRLYVNGAQVATRAQTGAIVASTGPLRFGGNSVWGEWFAGRLDELRVYNRALTAAEVAADVDRPVGPGQPPRLAVAPASLTFSGAQDGGQPAAKTLTVANDGGGALGFTASDDAAWLSVAPGSGSAPQTLTVTASTAGLAAGTYTANVTVAAPGVAGAPATIPVTLTVTAPAPPALAVAPASLAFAATVGGSAPAAKTLAVTNAGSGALSYSAADDAAWLAVTPASGSAPGTLTVTASPAGLAAGTYTGAVIVTAPGATGSPRSIPVTFTVTAAPTGLVAAYGFDEPSGAATDASGSGNTGTVNGATRTASGRFGGALAFDGVNDRVSVPHSASLALTNAMTIEAWVAPDALGGWRTVLLKERAGDLNYALYGSDDQGRPSVFGRDRGTTGAAALGLGTWTHVAGTYDGATLRFYVNGAQVATRALTGTLASGTGPLSIGGNGVWGEWFSGRIDEVRVYNRVLSAADIQGDMTRAVSGGA